MKSRGKHLRNSKLIENIIDAELSSEQKENQSFFIAFYNPESKQIKMCHYQAKNYEEACFILAKINILRQKKLKFIIKNCGFLIFKRLQKKKKKVEKN